MSDLTGLYRPSSMIVMSKFSKRIVEAVMSGKLKMPSGVRKYIGVDDHDQNLFEFFGAAQIQGWSMPTGNKNSNKFCEYHHDKGHDIDDCWILKQEIEKAVKTGRLSHVFKTVKEGKGGPVIHKVINMVQWGGVGSSRVQKRQAQLLE